MLIDIAGNIAVFVPLGAALTAALPGELRRRWLLATALGAAFSLSIELIQSTLATRVASADDWALNTLGVAVGVGRVYGLQNATSNE